jgi:hypothetical protein
MNKNKCKILLVVINLILFLVISAGCQTASKQPEIISTLNEFYLSYIKELSSDFPDMDRLMVLKKKFCSSRLLNKLENQDLDYDPFLNSQDADQKWAESIEISRGYSDYQYNVSYFDSFSSQRIVIRLEIVLERNQFKIDSIIE